jgi:Zn-dependent protease with chaperone function
MPGGSTTPSGANGRPKGSASAAEETKRRGGAVFASEVLEGVLRVAITVFPSATERLTGAATRPGAGGTLLFFGGIAAAAALCRTVPALLAGVAPSRGRAGVTSAGGLIGLIASEIVGVAGRAALGLLIVIAAGVVSAGGSWRRWSLALFMAAVFVALEVAGAALGRAFEKDLLHYEPGESVSPLRRPELVERVRKLCADMGVPEMASNVMVDLDDEENLNAFAMYKVIVLSKRTAMLPDVEHAAAIVAHEVAHVTLQHVNKSTAIEAAISAARFALVFCALILPGLPGGPAWLSSALGTTTAPRSVALLYFLARPVFDELAMLVALAYSRASELTADEVGIRAVGVKKYLEMLAMLNEANPGYSEYYDALLEHRMTHPPNRRRTDAAAAFGRRLEARGSSAAGGAAYAKGVIETLAPAGAGPGAWAGYRSLGRWTPPSFVRGNSAVVM